MKYRCRVCKRTGYMQLKYTFGYESERVINLVVLRCPQCGGDGYVDWITNLTQLTIKEKEKRLLEKHDLKYVNLMPITEIQYRRNYGMAIENADRQAIRVFTAKEGKEGREERKCINADDVMAEVE